MYKFPIVTLWPVKKLSRLNAARKSLFHLSWGGGSAGSSGLWIYCFSPVAAIHAQMFSLKLFCANSFFLSDNPSSGGGGGDGGNARGCSGIGEYLLRCIFRGGNCVNLKYNPSRCRLVVASLCHSAWHCVVCGALRI